MECLINLHRLAELGDVNGLANNLKIITNTRLLEIPDKDGNYIPWAPANNKQFGFDAYICDVDPADKPYSDTKRKWAYWNDAAGTAWDNLSNAGTIVLSTAVVGAAGVANNELINFSITNPASEYLELKNTNNISFNNIKIYNVLGKLVLNQNGTATRIDIANLKSGVYFVNVYNNNQLIGNSKLLKR